MLRSRRADLGIILTVVGLVCFGIAMVYSASVIVGYALYHDSQLFVRKQLISALAGFILLVVCANIDYRVWQKWAATLFGVTLLLLISVFLFSRGEINGAHRWIEFGGISFQPSELAKLTFLMYLAAWLTERKDRMSDTVGTFLPFLGVLGIVSFLLLAQPDFGTLMIFVTSAIAVYVVAGLTWPQLLIGAGSMVAAIALILAEPYRRDRITTFLNPTDDATGIGWHVRNIMIAIGSGSWFGLGFGASGQKRLFLPEPHTDSIFAVITEELGFVVAVLVIAAYVFLVYRGYRLAMRTTDTFARLLTVGIMSWIAIQTFLNLASMTHLVPLVGIPLPFISYGGTNLIITLAAVGVVINISRTAPFTEREEALVPPRRKR
jgi:cell division protein FtsW